MSRSPIRFDLSWYLCCLLREGQPIFSVYALMMTRNGITPLQLSTLFIVWSATAAIAEVPTGVIADHLTRRWLLVLSQILRTLAFLTWFWSPNYLGFMTGFVLWGIGSSLWSGTAEALLYETLSERGRAHEFPRIFGGGAAAANIGIGLGLVAGGWLANFGFALPLLISAGTPLLTAVWLLRMFGNPPRTAPSQQGEPVAPLTRALADFRAVPQVRLAALVFAFVLVFFGVFDEYVSLLLDATGMSLSLIGLSFTACYAVRALGMALVGRLSGLRPLPALMLAGLLLLGALATHQALPIAFGCMLYFGLNGFAEVRLTSDLQATMSGAARATVTSLARFGPNLTGTAIYLLIGLMATGHDYIVAAWVAGFGTLLAAFAVRCVPSWRPVGSNNGRASPRD